MNTNTEIKPWKERVAPEIIAKILRCGYGVAEGAMMGEISELKTENTDLRAEVARLQAALADRDAKQVQGEIELPEPVGMFAPAGEHGDKFPVWHRAQVLEIVRAAVAQRVGCGGPVAWRVAFELFSTLEQAKANVRNPALSPEPLYKHPPAAVTDADKRDAALPACQCFTEQQEQYCVRQRKCQGKAVAYASIAASEQEGK